MKNYIKWLIIFLIIFWIVKADDDVDNKIIYDELIEKECLLHTWSWELFFEDTSWYRCIKILQWIYRFETDFLRAYNNKNIFNFRSPKLKKQWKKEFWAIWVNNWFIVFDNEYNSIRFAVDRFYKYDKYKTITQIISWWCYISPVDNIKKCFWWFTLTKEHWTNYIFFMKKYYKDDMNFNKT